MYRGKCILSWAAAMVLPVSSVHISSDDLDLVLAVNVSNVGFNGSLVIETLILHLDCDPTPLVAPLYTIAALLAFLVLAKYLRVLVEVRKHRASSRLSVQGYY